MSDVMNVLRDSFEMLFERPKLFVPRLISTTVSSLILIGWGAGTISRIQMLYFFPLILLLGGFVPVMISAMVKLDEGNLLAEGFRQALGMWRQVLGLIAVTLVLAFINAVPLALGVAAFLTTGKIVYLVSGVSVSLLIVLAAGYALYFVPVTVLENEKFSESLRKGLSTSRKNRRSVLLLTAFSLIVFLATLGVNSGTPQKVGFTFFFLGRMLSAVVGTYLLVISPNFYLSKEEAEE